MQNVTRSGLWMIGSESYGQMRPKSTAMGQMVIVGSGKHVENHSLTAPPLGQSSMEEVLQWSGGVWGGMGWGS